MTTGYDYRGGTDFAGALLRIAGKPELKMIHGSRHNLFYVIDKDDRDWDAPHAITSERATVRLANRQEHYD